MSTHNICFRREIRKILCGYPLLSVAMIIGKKMLNNSFCYLILDFASLKLLLTLNEITDPQNFEIIRVDLKFSIHKSSYFSEAQHSETSTNQHLSTAPTSV